VCKGKEEKKDPVETRENVALTVFLGSLAWMENRAPKEVQVNLDLQDYKERRLENIVDVAALNKSYACSPSKPLLHHFCNPYTNAACICI
ncbi:hypothetical protein E2320_011714, partial [Naja naja]